MADKNHVIASERVNASRFRIASVGLDGVTESGWPINLSCDSIDDEIIEVALSRDGKHLVYSIMTPIDTHNLLTVGTYVTFYACDLNGAGLHSVFRFGKHKTEMEPILEERQ